MRRVWLIVLLLSLGMNLGLGLGLLRDTPAPTAPEPASPEPPAGGPRLDERMPRPELMARAFRRRLDHMARRLDLDESQRAALWDLHRGMGEQFFAHRGRMIELRGRLQDVLTDTTTAWDDVRPLLREQSRLQADLDSLVVRIMFEERRILTGDQLQQYHEFVFPFGRGDGPGRGRGPGGRAGGPRHGGRGP